MKKIFSPLFIFFLIPLLSFGGNKDSGRVKHNVCININGGIGIPSDIRFGQEIRSSFGMFGRIGPFINVYATIPIQQGYFGFAGMLGYGLNTVDINTMVTEQGVEATSLQGGNYNTLTAMPGIFVKIPLVGATIDFHFLVGVLYFTTPTLMYSGVYNTYSQITPNIVGTWVENGTNIFSKSIDIGATLKWKLTNSFFWMLHADFLYSGLNGGIYITPQFTPVAKYYTPFGDVYSDLALFNLTFGIGYRL